MADTIHVQLDAITRRIDKALDQRHRRDFYLACRLRKRLLRSLFESDQAASDFKAALADRDV
jgi:hypothetical protein